MIIITDGGEIIKTKNDYLSEQYVISNNLITVIY